GRAGAAAAAARQRLASGQRRLLARALPPAPPPRGRGRRGVPPRRLRARSPRSAGRDVKRRRPAGGPRPPGRRDRRSADGHRRGRRGGSLAARPSPRARGGGPRRSRRPGPPRHANPVDVGPVGRAAVADAVLRLRRGGDAGRRARPERSRRGSGPQRLPRAAARPRGGCAGAGGRARVRLRIGGQGRAVCRAADRGSLRRRRVVGRTAARARCLSCARGHRARATARMVDGRAFVHHAAGAGRPWSGRRRTL
ncbi:MAG: hypothetical protein AVDCRST_MAG65-2251, partial [uncultured Solirubrobacteraceae bacterium]